MGLPARTRIAVKPPPEANDAVSEIGPFIVMFCDAFGPEYDPGPVPVHPENENPPFGVARIPTVLPALKKPLGGETEPPAPAVIVNWYCVVKFPWNMAADAGVLMVRGFCVGPSAQAENTYCVPLLKLCGVVHWKVWLLPAVNMNDAGTTCVAVPSTVTLNPAMFEVMVSCTWLAAVGST